MIIKKCFYVLCTLFLGFTLAGCGDVEVAPTNLDEASQTEDETATTLPDAYMNYGDTGEGEAYIVTANGNSQNGEVVQLRVTPDFKSAELSVVTRNLSSTTPLYVYVDGTRVVKLDNPDADTIITLEDDMVSYGEHTVTFVQYNNGDANEAIIFYRTSRYNVTL